LSDKFNDKELKYDEMSIISDEKLAEFKKKIEASE
jgi:hypothetical protein